MVVAYCGNDQCVNPTVFTITIWFGYFNSTLNPILYPLCNANFKTAFKRMLRFESPRSADQVILNGVQYHHQAPNGTNGNISNLPSKRVWCEWKNSGVSVQQIYECFLDVEILEKFMNCHLVTFYLSCTKVLTSTLDRNLLCFEENR